jgi:hypothetical protein
LLECRGKVLVIFITEEQETSNFLNNVVEVPQKTHKMKIEPPQFRYLSGSAGPDRVLRLAQEVLREQEKKSGDVKKVILFLDAHHNLVKDDMPERIRDLLGNNFFPAPHIIVVEPEYEVIPIAFYAEVRNKQTLLGKVRSCDAKEVARKIKLRQFLNKKNQNGQRYSELLGQWAAKFFMNKVMDRVEDFPPDLRWFKVFINDQDNLDLMQGF